jgi:hypothetical protein
MRKIIQISLVPWALVLAVALFAAHGDAGAATYPSNECASAKMKAAANRCDQVLKAWSAWTKIGKDPQARIERVANRAFDEQWAIAEDEAASQDVDCVDMTISGADMKALMDAAIDEIVAEVNDGLDLGVQEQAICGSRVLKSAAIKCKRLLQAESRYILDLSLDPDGARRDAAQAMASSQFSGQWDHATQGDCPTTATEEEIEGKVDALSDDVVTNTTVSPSVPGDGFMAITHAAGGEPGNPVSYEGDTLVPQCQTSSAFTFFAKRGSVNKLLMYYYGGGACWDTLTCVFQTCTQNANPTPPGLGGSGFGDLTNPDNPFKDWHVIQVPYCSCDIHLGDNAVDYPPIPPFVPGKHVEHRGYDNAKLAEKWAREHFLNPTDMFVTGSSAGSYGAMVHGVHLSAVYVASSINVMGDGGNGVATQDFLDTNFNNWGAMENLPDVPGIIGVPSSEMSIPLIMTSAASFYPGTNWSNYTTAFDGGGGGQTGFYNVMLNPDNPLGAQATWWNASCEFNDVMRQQAFDTADAAALENDNYRYYIATGSRHTGFGNPRVYDDTTGGVPTLVDWVNAMLDDSSGWVNVEADPFNVLFPGVCSSGSGNPGDRCNLNVDCPGGSCLGDDVKPDPLQPPFELVGSGDTEEVVVSCEE